MIGIPDTVYTRGGDAHVEYQVVGDGPDLTVRAYLDIPYRSAVG